MMTAEQFTQAYAEKFREMHSGTKVTITKALELEVKSNSADGSNLKAYLDNAFKEYLADPSSADEIIGRHVKSLAGSLENGQPFERQQLLPVVRHKDYVELGKLPFAHLLAGELFVIYAFDTPDMLKYADETALKKLGLREPELEAIGLENLRQVVGKPTIKTYPTLATVTASDAYMTSLLLIDDFWTDKRLSFRGEIVVIAVARDLMLVTGSEENEGLAAALKIAHEMINEVAYPISEKPIVRRQGKWQSFVQ